MALIAATMVVLAASLASFRGVQAMADVLSDRATPSIVAVIDMRTALIQADNAAIESFKTGAARLSGPGVQYQSHIATANRYLVQIAESNAAGDRGGQRLQLVGGLLISYLGLVERADAQYRKDDGSTLGIILLRYASKLLHAEILPELDRLRVDQEKAIDQRLSSNWMDLRVVLGSAAPMVVLLCCMLGTQRYFRRRFRRIVNPMLALATVLVLAFAAGPTVSLFGEARLRSLHDSVAELGTTWQAGTNAMDRHGQEILVQLINRECGTPTGHCGVTMEEYSLAMEASESTSTMNVVAAYERPNQQIDAVTQQATDASKTYYAETFMPAVALAILVLLVLAFQPRISEYRYEKP